MSRAFQEELKFRRDNCDYPAHVYYNARLYNQIDSTSSLEADFFETRVNEIVCGDLSDYELSIIRLNVPTDNLPIFFFSEIADAYVVTLEFAGFPESVTVQFVSQNTFNPNFRGVFNFQHMVDMINTAFATAFADLNAAAGPFPTATLPPVMYYDPIEERVYLEIQSAYIADGIDLYFNYTLFRFLQGLDIIFHGYNNANYKDIQLVIQDNGNNVVSPGLLRFDTEYANLKNWFEFPNIVITTNTIPIDYEYINSNDPNNAGVDTQLPILTDFINTRDIDTLRSDYIYEQIGPYKWIDLNSPSNQGLRKIQFRIFTQTRDGALRSVSISPDRSVTMKFLFRRKTINNYLLEGDK